MQIPLIPRSVLFGDPEKLHPLLSPNGKQLAYMAPHNGALNVWLKTIGMDDDRPVTEDSGSNLRAHAWAQDGRSILYIQDKDGTEYINLYAADLETGQHRNLTPFENVSVQLIKRHPYFPHTWLIALNQEDQRLYDAYRLDLVSARLEMAAKNPGNVRQWVGDACLQVRAAVASSPDGGAELWVRESETAPWQTLISWDAENALSSAPLSFSGDGRFLYLLDSREANATRLVKIEISSRELTVLAADPQYDVSSVLLNPNTQTIEAVAFMRERLVWQAIDPTVNQDLKIVSTLAHGDFRITSRDEADRTWLVAFTADNGPLSYYAYDRQTQSATFLFNHQPALAQYPLAVMHPISFQTRDGLTIHGYLTFPPGRGQSQLPMVLMVHGGPWARDSWGFDSQVQWLANRGYLCLQVNFRGSTGYGRNFLNAGDHEWGGKMQDDLIDAVNWAIAQGYAHPQQIAIYGGSYGGYAALVGATFTPDVFCCAIDVVGPVNLVTFMRTLPPYWEAIRPIFYRRVGNPETEADFLLSRSPIIQAENLKIPLLIVQGANDPRVKISESEQIVAILREKQIPHDYILFPDEGHGFSKPTNRLTFYQTAEKFLATHLNGRCE